MLAAVVAFCFLTSLAKAQTVATAGFGASVIRYQEFLASGAATLTTTVQHDSRRLSVGAQGSWTVFESGNPILQGSVAAAWLTQSRNRWGFEVGGSAGAFRYSDEPASGHLLGRLRGHLLAEHAGAWIGATSGVSVDATTEAPLELSIGAWATQRDFSFSASLSNTALVDDRFLDVNGAVRWAGKRLELELRGGARPWVNARDSLLETGVWGEASALVRVQNRIALTLTGGSYPSDPVRGILGASYASAALRFVLAGSEGTRPLAIPAPLLAAARAHEAATTSSLARLELVSAGDEYVVRIYGPAAKQLELMGDFTDWEPRALERVGAGFWEIRTALTPGAHRLNVRIDGGDWLVPAGTRSEESEFGSVGIVVVR